MGVGKGVGEVTWLRAERPPFPLPFTARPEKLTVRLTMQGEHGGQESNLGWAGEPGDPHRPFRVGSANGSRLDPLQNLW